MEHKIKPLIKQENLFKNNSEYLTTKDFSLTKEQFKLLYNEEYDVLITHPIPENLNTYYQFESYISHTDSKKTFLDKVYQIVRNYTLKKKLKLINSFQSEEKKILDIGCGTGDFLLTCKKENWKTIGVEPNPKANTIAKNKGLEIKNSIEEIVALNQKFDVITLWHVLEHVPNLMEYILQLKKLLTKNGTLVIAVPNYKSYDSNYYKEFWAAYDVPRHIWHFSKKSIQKLFKHVNLSVVEILPMKFDSYYVSILSERYKTKKFKPLSAFIRGYISNWKARRTKEYSSHIYLLKNKE